MTELELLNSLLSILFKIDYLCIINQVRYEDNLFKDLISNNEPSFKDIEDYYERIKKIFKEVKTIIGKNEQNMEYLDSIELELYELQGEI